MLIILFFKIANLCIKVIKNKFSVFKLFEKDLDKFHECIKFINSKVFVIRINYFLICKKRIK